MRVVHCMREACTHYCGRKSSIGKAIGNPVDMSVLGNPFPMKSEAERDDVCDAFETVARNSERLMDEIARLPDDAVLGCFCHPKRCHCHSIAKIHSEIRKQQKEKQHDEK